MISMWIFWCVLLVLFTLSAIFSQSYFILVLLIILLVLPVILMLVNRVKAKIEFDVKLPTSIEKNQQAIGVVELKNNSLKSYRTVKGSLEFENILTGENGKQNISLSLLCKNKNECLFRLKSEFCGNIKISVKKLRLYDFFGLTYKTIRIDKTFNTVVMPDVFPVNIKLVSGEISNDDDINYANKRGQDLSEIFDFREYSVGDSLRQVQWKLSQKHNNLIVKEGSYPSPESVALVMLNGENSDAVNSSAMAEAFVSISQSLCENGISHKVVLTYENDIQFHLYNISNEEDLSAVIPKILSENKVSQSRSFFENCEDLAFEHIVCITSDEKLGTEALEYCSGVILIGECDNNEIISLSCENIEQELFEISI